MGKSVGKFMKSQDQPKAENKLFSYVVIIASTIIITYFHYGVPKHHTVIHISHYYAFYIIAIYTAYKFGLRGGFFISVILTAIYSPSSYQHILQLDFPHHSIPAIVEVTMVYAVALLAGVLSNRLKREKLKVEKVSEEMLELERQVAHDDRLRVLGQLSAGIAHEIRNPLAALKSGISLIKSGKSNDQVIDILGSEIDQLNSFVDRFLQYARFGTEKIEAFSIEHFIMELTELTKLLASRQSVQIEYENNISDGTMMYGDKNAIKQALLNIIINGIEASQKRELPTIKIIVDVTETEILFKIADNGEGISDTILNKVFEPFFTTKDNGTGLGLALAIKIAKEHGGQLKAANTSDGCEFIMQINRKENERLTNRG
ncbi:MAG: hypothetical protein C0603_09475 [Denitrovibrio sp.]|nr:MAG: hypothetical protein C0603_09475 [Denitrovibrio sp.]